MVQSEVSEWDGVHFQREHQSGIFLGLVWLQIVYLAVGAAIMLMLFAAGLPFPIGPILALATGAGFFFTGVPRVQGRPLVEWAVAAIRFLLRGAGGFLRYLRPFREVAVSEADSGPQLAEVSAKGRVKANKPYRLNLPGEFAELLVYALPSGAVLVWDPRTREAIVCAKISTVKAFPLESVESMEDRTRAFSEVLTGLARVPGVALTQMSDQTTRISGTHIRAWYRRRQEVGEATGAAIDPFLHSALDKAMDQAEGQPVHEMWLTVVLSKDRLADRARSAGGGLGGMMDIAQTTMTTIEGMLPPSGAHVVQWHTPRSLAELIRSAFDPGSTVGISERTGDFAGVHPESAGPMGMEEYRSHVVSDSGFHRTYMVSEWPQSQANLGFLGSLIFVGDFRHTVTVLHKRRDTRQALKQTKMRKATWDSSERTRKRLGQPPSLEHQRELADIEDEEQQLVDGHAALTQIGLVTISGSDERDLEANCTELITRAAEASCEVRPMWFQQASGFVAAALPLGRVRIP